jgi:hypothetical protein
MESGWGTSCGKRRSNTSWSDSGKEFAQPSPVLEFGTSVVVLGVAEEILIGWRILWPLASVLSSFESDIWVGPCVGVDVLVGPASSVLSFSE